MNLSSQENQEEAEEDGEEDESGSSGFATTGAQILQRLSEPLRPRELSSVRWVRRVTQRPAEATIRIMKLVNLALIGQFLITNIAWTNLPSLTAAMHSGARQIRAPETSTEVSEDQASANERTPSISKDLLAIIVGLLSWAFGGGGAGKLSSRVRLGLSLAGCWLVWSPELAPSSSSSSSFILLAQAKGVAGLGKAGGDGSSGSDKSGQQVPPEVYRALSYAGTAFLLTLSIPLLLYGMNKLLNKIEDCLDCGSSRRRREQKLKRPADQTPEAALEGALKGAGKPAKDKSAAPKPAHLTTARGVTSPAEMAAQEQSKIDYQSSQSENEDNLFRFIQQQQQFHHHIQASRQMPEMAEIPAMPEIPQVPQIKGAMPQA